MEGNYTTKKQSQKLQ